MNYLSIIRAATILVALHLNGCALFNKKSQNGEGEPSITVEQLRGSWIQKKQFDLLNDTSTDVPEQTAQILIFSDSAFSKIESVGNQEQCVNQKNYKVSGKLVVFEEASEKPLIVKGIAEGDLSLVEYGKTGIPIYERMYQKISEENLKKLFLKSTASEVCPAFLGFAGPGNQGTGGDEGVFRPDIDVDGEYTQFLVKDDLSIQESKTQSDLGYLRFVREAGATYRPGSQPASKPYCEFNFVNVGQIPKSGSEFTLRKGLAFKVVRVSRAKLAGSKSSLDILFDGLQMQCIHPSSSTGISNGVLLRTVGPEIQIL